MGMVIEGLLALGLVLLIFWLFGLRGSVTRDQAEAEARRTQEAEAAARAAREARLMRKGEKLRCLGCEHTFPGPLPATGCPHCHLSALVVTERDFRQGRQAAQTLKRHTEDES